MDLESLDRYANTLAAVLRAHGPKPRKEAVAVLRELQLDIADSLNVVAHGVMRGILSMEEGEDGLVRATFPGHGADKL